MRRTQKCVGKEANPRIGEINVLGSFVSGDYFVVTSRLLSGVPCLKTGSKGGYRLQVKGYKCKGHIWIFFFFLLKLLPLQTFGSRCVIGGKTLISFPSWEAWNECEHYQRGLLIAQGMYEWHCRVSQVSHTWNSLLCMHACVCDCVFVAVETISGGCLPILSSQML